MQIFEERSLKIQGTENASLSSEQVWGTGTLMWLSDMTEGERDRRQCQGPGTSERGSPCFLFSRVWFFFKTPLGFYIPYLGKN